MRTAKHPQVNARIDVRNITSCLIFYNNDLSP